jgi:hypothetical protein
LSEQQIFTTKVTSSKKNFLAPLNAPITGTMLNVAEMLQENMDLTTRVIQAKIKSPALKTRFLTTDQVSVNGFQESVTHYPIKNMTVETSETYELYNTWLWSVVEPTQIINTGFNYVTINDIT